ncbi:hypothetical protein BofuT4_P157460.1 [Botrytis cinerea T4]|uniref:Uncharacterized protein n=1 Tax=Botryotinia fuckeliana (strain T4) TaxID=999810 RepID=G2YUQ2_BOTF4|nr:hypothetical protein BofuT4_P157460.1 [Botrytis cinerea T4]
MEVMCVVWREVGVFDGISRWLCTAHLNQPSDLDLKTHRPRKKIGSSLPCLAAAWVWTEHESWDQICFPSFLNERRTPNRDFYKEGMRESSSLMVYVGARARTCTSPWNEESVGSSAHNHNASDS